MADRENSNKLVFPREKECLFTKVGKHLKHFVASRVAFHGLVNGNLLLTGEHGYKFAAHIPLARQIDLLQESVDTTRILIAEKFDIDITCYKILILRSHKI